MKTWQPIETAPKDGTKVFLFFADGDIGAGIWCELVGDPDGCWITEENGTTFGENPTHWMLPDPPKET